MAMILKRMVEPPIRRMAADGVVGRISRAAASPRECHGCLRWPTGDRMLPLLAVVCSVGGDGGRPPEHLAH